MKFKSKDIVTLRRHGGCFRLLDRLRRSGGGWWRAWNCSGGEGNVHEDDIEHIDIDDAKKIISSKLKVARDMKIHVVNEIRNLRRFL